MATRGTGTWRVEGLQADTSTATTIDSKILPRIILNF
jgi:hypothetical protein